jgi:hypothetical protein
VATTQLGLYFFPLRLVRLLVLRLVRDARFLNVGIFGNLFVMINAHIIFYFLF